jgi:hypothetical protein
MVRKKTALFCPLRLPTRAEHTPRQHPKHRAVCSCGAAAQYFCQYFATARVRRKCAVHAGSGLGDSARGASLEPRLAKKERVLKKMNLHDAVSESSSGTPSRQEVVFIIHPVVCVCPFHKYEVGSAASV